MDSLVPLDALHAKLQEILIFIDKVCTENGITYSLDGGSLLGAVRHQGFIPWDDDLDIMMDRKNYEKFLAVMRKTDNPVYVLQEEVIDNPLYFSKVRMNGTSLIEKNTLKGKWKLMHQGIFVDIFPFDYVSSNAFNRFFQGVFAMILNAQALYCRGYDSASFIKRVIMIVAMVFYPFRNRMHHFITSITRENAGGIIGFFGPNGFPSKKNMQSVDLLDAVDFVKFNGVSVPGISKRHEYMTSLYGDYFQLPPEEKRVQAMHAKFFSDKVDYRDYLKLR